jgi:hypothetical protein
MDGYARSSSSGSARLAALTALACAAGAGCVVDELPPITATTSLRVELVRPDPGSPDARLPADAREVTVRIEALDARGEVDVDFSGTIDLYAHFLGSLTPSLREPPLATAELVGGASDEVTFELPPVYGPTFVWAEHVTGDEPTFATGTSARLWYREPTIADVRRPEDESALDALESSPLEQKQVTIGGSRHGARGRLVVTSVFAQGFTLQDVACEDDEGTPPCLTGAYDSVFVFTFSRPSDAQGRLIRRGDVVRSMSGGVTIFNGLVQFSFPQTILADDPSDVARIAPPVVVQPSWLSTLIELERVESSLLAVEDAVLCPLDQEYETYNQWKLDVGRGCRDAINVISEGRVDDFDPADYVGETIPRVVGVLLPVNIGTFHVWIIYPRDADDLTLPAT